MLIQKEVSMASDAAFPGNMGSSRSTPRLSRSTLLVVILAAACLCIVAISFVHSMWGPSPPPALMLHTEADMRGSTPAGTLYPYVGAARDLPKTWLPCEGQMLRQADYPDLFRVLEHRFTHGKKGEGTFCLPDYRGMRTLPSRLLFGIRTNVAVAGAGGLPEAYPAQEITWAIKAVDN